MLSWKKLGYKVIVYTDLNNYDPFLDHFERREYRTILNGNPEDILPFSDLFRYKRLYQSGGIWIDADMFLLKKLANLDYIISSERTAQKGAFKRQITSIPNIGVMKFPAKDKLLEHCIKKIEKSKSKSKKCQKFMFVFQDAILKTFPEHKEHVAPPEIFCPVNWSNVKDLYYSDTFTSKYGQEINTQEWILENAVACHLWENLSLNKYKIDFSKVRFDSLFAKLKLKV
jgi:hypothetical protein